MGTIYYACDDAGKRWAHIDKAHLLFDAVMAAGLSGTDAPLTADFLTAHLAANPGDAHRILPMLRWQREVCGGRPLSIWSEHVDEPQWIDWDRKEADINRPDWTEDDPMTPAWWANREPVTAKEGKE